MFNAVKKFFIGTSTCNCTHQKQVLFSKRFTEAMVSSLRQLSSFLPFTIASGELIVRCTAARPVVVNLFYIGTHFQICSITCTPLACTKIKFCKKCKNFSDFYEVAVLAVFGYHLSAFLNTEIPVKN